MENKILWICFLIFIAYIIALMLVGCAHSEVNGRIYCNPEHEPVVNLDMRCENPKNETHAKG